MNGTRPHLSSVYLLTMAAITLPCWFAAANDDVVSFRRIPLEEPAVAISDGSVRNGRLYFSDHHQGIREVDLDTGRTIRQIDIGSSSDFSTVYLGISEELSIVFGSGLRWYWLDPSWGEISSGASPHFTGQGPPVVRPGRAIVYGAFMPEATMTSFTWLATLYRDGTVVPLAEFGHGLADIDVARRVKFMAVVAGGVTAAPGGGSIAIDPLSYRVLVLDHHDRLVASWKGANPRYHPPNLDAMPTGYRPDQRDAYFRWHLAQVLVKRPVFLADDLIAIVVGLPDGPLHQRYEVDLYRPDGETVATGLRIPPIPEQRVVVADTDDGRLMLMAQEKLWPPGSSTAVYIVDVPLTGASTE